MEQKVITFKQAFEALDKIGNNSLFKFAGEKITPLNNRIRLIFIDSGLGHSSKFCYLSLLGVPKRELMDNIRANFEQDLSNSFVFVYYYDPFITSPEAVRDFANKLDNTTLCIQQTERKEWKKLKKGSYLTSTEELGTLISMLYFREKGYIVQKPRDSYGKEGKNEHGVDDVVAWKSLVMDELRKFGFIDRGCHISELACLRWLGKVSNSSRDFDNYITKEILLTEVKSSRKKGIPNSSSRGGVSQLVRAEKEKIAKKLFICFPVVNENVEGIFKEIKSKNKPAVGAILFDDKGVYKQESETFPDENMDSEIDKYERDLKRALLNNFYFDEIVEMIKELSVDTKNKGVNEVLLNFRNKVEEIPTSYILEKLNRLLK